MRRMRKDLESYIYINLDEQAFKLRHIYSKYPAGYFTLMSYITHFPQDTRQHSETNAKEIVLNQRWRPGTADISKRLVSKQRDMFRKKF